MPCAPGGFGVTAAPLRVSSHGSAGRDAEFDGTRFPAGEPVWARHNSPFSLWFLRRNEILIPVATTAD